MVVAVHLLLELPVAVVSAFLAIRLLGVRRSWIGSVLAGVVGWALGNLLAVGVAGDWGAARVSLSTVPFSILFTMLTAISLDFMARPGTLARGEDAGLIVVGNPVQDLRRWIEPLARYREVVGIARRNGLVGGARSGRRTVRRAGQGLDPEALRLTLEQAGVVFVKFGQMASTRDDLLPADLRAELARLQAHVEPTPAAAMRDQLEAELGGTVDDHFSHFDWTPLGSASIAQAYAATLTSGEDVVVKIQRPGIEEVVERDCVALLRLANFLDRATPQGRQLRIAQMAEEFTRSLRQELDFSREANQGTEIALATSPDARLRIPEVHFELSTARVLVQERFHGVSIGERGAMDRTGVDPAELADRLVATMTRHMLTDGHFHADPHPGNVLLLDSGDLGLIDFGATGRVDPPQRAALLEMTLAVLRNDAAALREGIEQVTVIRPETSEIALERALRRFMADNITDGDALSVTAFSELMPLLATFNIDVPSELTTFFRALALLDGTVRTIHPGYSLIAGMRRMFDPRAASSAPKTSRRDQLLEVLLRDVPRLQRLPAKVDRIATLAARGELRTRVSLLSTEQDVAVVTRLLNRMLLAVIGSGLGLASAILVASSPRSNGQPPLPAVLGYLGLGIAAILVLRVVATVVRDGHN